MFSLIQGSNWAIFWSLNRVESFGQTHWRKDMLPRFNQDMSSVWKALSQISTFGWLAYRHTWDGNAWVGVSKSNRVVICFLRFVGIYGALVLLVILIRRHSYHWKRQWVCIADLVALTVKHDLQNKLGKHAFKYVIKWWRHAVHWHALKSVATFIPHISSYEATN